MRVALDRLMPVLAALLVLAAVPSCGDESETSGGSRSSGDLQDETKLLPAAVLDGVPGKLDKERTAAALNFWKPLADRARAIEEAAVLGSAPLGSPAVADLIEGIFRAATVEGPGVEPEFAATAVSVQRLGPVAGPFEDARLERLAPSRGARLLKKPLIHPLSPPAKVERVPLLSAERARSDTPEAFAVYSTAPPTREEMLELAGRGARFWLVGQERGELSAEESQFAYPRALEPGESEAGHLLPVPLVYLAAAFHNAAMDTVNNVNESWSLETVNARGEVVETGAPVVTARIRGVDSTRKLIVTCGRDPRPHHAGSGSAALELACILEVARTILAVMRTPPGPRPAIDIEFAWVMDRGAGYEWVAATRTADEMIVGIVNVQDVVPKNVTSSDVLLTLDGTERYSAVERAFHQAVTSLAGEEGLWARSGVTALSPPRAHDEAARLCGQERVPVVRLGAASTAADRTLRPSSKYPPVGPSRTVADPVHDLVFSSGDEVRAFIRGHMAPQVSVARALAFGILRTTEAFAPRE